MPRPASSVPQLLSDVSGRIAHALQALPAEEPEAVPRLMECHAAVRQAVGRDARYTVLVHPQHEDAVRAAGRGYALDVLRWNPPRTVKVTVTAPRMEGSTLRLGTIPGWTDFTPWVQDTFLVRPGPERVTLLASPEIRRPEGSHDADVAPFLANALAWHVELLPLGLEASNVLTDGRCVIVGTDVVAGRSRATVHALFVALRGTERIVTVPRGRPQPLAHEDLYLTLAGNGPSGPLALVGSQRVAATVRGRPFRTDDVEAGLDAVARDLERVGYDVRRLPLEAHTAERARYRGWASYNNALVECGDDASNPPVRRVVLPAYGTDGGPLLRELDTAAAEVWRAAGFTVRFAEGPFDWLAAHEGSLRCLTKVLARR